MKTGDFRLSCGREHVIWQKVGRAERGYRLYNTLTDVQSKGVGEKIAFAYKLEKLIHLVMIQ